MNGNANLNANNLTPQNVVDWRNKLNITDLTDLTEAELILLKNKLFKPFLAWSGSLSSNVCISCPIDTNKYFLILFIGRNSNNEQYSQIYTTQDFVLTTNSNPYDIGNNTASNQRFINLYYNNGNICSKSVYAFTLQKIYLI